MSYKYNPYRDTISRAAAIDALRYAELGCELEAIEALPSAERKKGRWKPFDLTWGRSIYFCTACNDATEVPTSYDKPVYKYCPWCGAEMENSDEL